ncbi:hypothetical protein [Paraburkholderia diazotrophica]|uniref:hypothetical protein n=1 Tax=Paraburkholderia diazotrophica TaxID=667676 RepID=UPI00115FEEE7|nr:hypothetical protein [Paraburkholderia diazotrophica]
MRKILLRGLNNRCRMPEIRNTSKHTNSVNLGTYGVVLRRFWFSGFGYISKGKAAELSTGRPLWMGCLLRADDPVFVAFLMTERRNGISPHIALLAPPVLRCARLNAG